MQPLSEKFVNLGKTRRIWAVGALRGDTKRLFALHDHLVSHFAVGDRLVYLGNYLGSKTSSNEEIFEELLAFRAALLARPGMEASDIVHLRGPSEEAWQRLLRLQFAPLPPEMLENLIEAGCGAYLSLYNISLQEARSIAHAGSMAITRWTNILRAKQRDYAGHEPLTSSMRRAAVTAPLKNNKSVLFVPANFDCARSLNDQGDNLWFSDRKFALESHAAKNYSRIIRGTDLFYRTAETTGAALTLDGGCGQGGPLMCGNIDPSGVLREIITFGGHSVVDQLNQTNAFPAPILTKQTSFSLSGSKKPIGQEDKDSTRFFA